ncbi:hypothetical protein [uncultured Azohydromonas sp.]|uniref:hypothetical protein n=1 Tax=uncultured Azohydromonas sp. TaxID=487342 RepID=UPI002614F297|nr:hypothetical protein [uncultured Azohydromonas sp.]
MNSTASASTSRTSAPAPAASRDGDRRAAPDNRDVADFERALRQRSQLQGKERQPRHQTEAETGAKAETETDTQEPRCEAAPLAPPAGLPAAFALALAQAQPPAPIEATPGARGLVEPPPAALRSELSQPTGASGPEGARAFEVSLREPLGGGVTLHAVAPAAGARWALSVGANGLNPQELRRNLGRLEERLRAKALPHEALELLSHSDQPDDQP